MSAVAVDASVWIAAVDTADTFCGQSRAFIAGAVRRGAQLVIPSFAVTEVACALARKHRNAAVARRLTGSMLTPGQVLHVPVDARLLATSVRVGTGAFLRGADALYAAAAQLAGAALVSWDDELIQRAGALTPTDWLAANP
jgi:predicted nucleic acid-binding protein